MVGSASKAFPELPASDKQQSLLHFYKKLRPATDVVKASNAAGMETVPNDIAVSSLSSRKDTTAMSSLVPVRPEADQRMGSSNACQGHNVVAPRKSRSRKGKLKAAMQDDPVASDTHKRSHQPVNDGLNSLDKQGYNVTAKPSHRELYSIFTPRSCHRISSQTSTNLTEPSSSQRISPSTDDSQKKSDVDKQVGHDSIELATPSNREECISDTAAAVDVIGPIILINDELEHCGSQAAPIDLNFCPPSKVEQIRAIHPFFAHRVAKWSENNSADISQPVRSQLMWTPWPDAETQHTRGFQSQFLSSFPSLFPPHRRLLPTLTSPQPNLRFLETINSQSRICTLKPHVPTSFEREEVLSSLPNCHREHTAISRLLDVKPESYGAVYTGEAWTHKWRPRNTAEVLGNEDNVRYMKDWLQALEIHSRQTLDGGSDVKSKLATSVKSVGAKRPIVVRAVEKKRGHKRRRVESDDGSDLDNWMVEEDEEEEEAVIDFISEDDRPLDASLSLDDEAYVFPMKARREARDFAIRPLLDKGSSPGFSHLTNTILLTGPPGSGKTSAVYACAEELGWEIFEVYPGIGKRSGANISSLVGDVGKNHLVGRREASGNSAKGPSMQSFIRSGFGFLAEDHGHDTKREHGNSVVRQSAILLEEVDVLFREDANFWPAVVNIIKSSHRPVFMTCNDVSLVPRDVLPLQATLHFQPCPPALAVSFLQSVCLAEDRIIARQELNDLYAMTYQPIGPDQPDEPQIPFPSQPQPCSDLRHVLNELQFWCQGEASTRGDGDNAVVEEVCARAGGSLVPPDLPSEILADWSRPLKLLSERSLEESKSQECQIFRLWHHSEYASYVDAHLERRSWDVLEALAIDRYEASVDDEIGHALLQKPMAVRHSASLSFYNWDKAISREALVKSRHVFEISGAGPRVRSYLLGSERGATLDSRSLMRRRAANQTHVVSYLDDVIPLSAPLLPRAPAVLEYAAYMRQMVSVDDAMENAALAVDGTRDRRGRGTRSRWRICECRHLMLSAEGLEAARRTRLDVVSS